VNDQVNFILSIIDKKYANSIEHENLVNSPINWRSVLRKALDNRILYVLSNSVLGQEDTVNSELKPVMEDIATEGDRWAARFHNTLNVLEQVLGHHNYVIIKTFRFYQDVTFDVDIVVFQNNSEAIENLTGKSLFDLKMINGGRELSPLVEDFVAIDVYENFFFRDKVIADRDFICDNLSSYHTTNGHYYVPSVESELLLHVAQVNFQLRFITLNDFLQVTRLIADNTNDINWQKLFSQVAENGWINSFTHTLSIIDALYRTLYDDSLNIPLEASGQHEKIKVNFPYVLSPLTVLRYDFELFKKSFIKARYFVDDFKYFYFEFVSFYVRKRIPIYRDWVDLQQLATSSA